MVEKFSKMFEPSVEDELGDTDNKLGTDSTSPLMGSSPLATEGKNTKKEEKTAPTKRRRRI